MNDGVIESFIKARKNKMLPLWCILIVLAAVAIDVVVYLLVQLIGMLLWILVSGIAFYGILILIRLNRLEYELSVVMGEMTISEIRNQTSRKKVMSFDIKDAENFRKATPEDVAAKEQAAKENQHKVLCCFGDEDTDLYYFTARAKDEGVTYDIFMAPDNRIKKEIAERNFEARRVITFEDRL